MVREEPGAGWGGGARVPEGVTTSEPLQKGTEDDLNGVCMNEVGSDSIIGLVCTRSGWFRLGEFDHLSSY